MAIHIFKYNETLALDAIPINKESVFHDEILDLVNKNWRIIALFVLPFKEKAPSMPICAILSKDSELAILQTEPLSEFLSLAPDCPQAELFEREIYEDWQIKPRHHPWLKPVRKISDSIGNTSSGEYNFYRVRGEQIHEVGVGPVHAGIIEPGHFRFQCYGENVLNLEIALGYQFRGIEKTLLDIPANTASFEKRLRIVECIAGDASIAHATAQCVLWERFLENAISDISEHSQRLRRIGLELERLACHCGDLGAIAGDTGFLPTSSWNGRIRGDFLNLTALICGNRFGREYVCLGGVNWDLSQEDCLKIKERLNNSITDAINSSKFMLNRPSVLNRLTDTGVLTEAQGKTLGLVGVAARASGVSLDARFQTPLADLPLYDTAIRTSRGGDVLGRSQVRFLEMGDSSVLINHDIEWLMNNTQKNNCDMPEMKLPAMTLGVAQVESWRGEVCHLAITGSEGQFWVNKFYDPSFHNWSGLALAMRNGQISDFPLCNKSFNLSYCGYDL